MIKPLERPNHLADFISPPLTEVVLGIQFAEVAAYSQIYAGNVWDLYKHEYPKVLDYPPIPSQFEVFGINQPQGINFGLIEKGQHDRFWFLSKDDQELIQFQSDRILHNWRKQPREDSVYPRFEFILEKFIKEISCLDSYYTDKFSQRLAVNQAEITYINIIPYGGSEKFASISDVIKVLNITSDEADDVQASYRRTLLGSDDEPFARLYADFNTLQNQSGSKALSFSLTVRGAPAGNSIPDCMDFLKIGREVIVDEFEAVTTESAQAEWGRKL